MPSKETGTSGQTCIGRPHRLSLTSRSMRLAPSMLSETTQARSPSSHQFAGAIPHRNGNHTWYWESRSHSIGNPAQGTGSGKEAGMNPTSVSFCLERQT